MDNHRIAISRWSLSDEYCISISLVTKASQFTNHNSMSASMPILIVPKQKNTYGRNRCQDYLTLILLRTFQQPHC